MNMQIEYVSLIHIKIVQPLDMFLQKNPGFRITSLQSLKNVTRFFTL